jgi:5S rRNA maturation endonuclease (ribonuclease M5)
VSDISELVTVLDGKASGAGWIAHCPAHDDSIPSLSISEIDGKVLLHCFAGCSQDAVIAALQERGLWPNGNGKPEAETVYPYIKDGKRQYEKVRFYVDGKKTFYIRNDAGKGRGGPAILYRLDELRTALKEGKPVIIVEGEKDVDTLRALGFTATTLDTGCKSPWEPEYTAEFPGGAVVYLCGDADKPGQEYVKRIKVALAHCDVRMVDLGYPIAENHGKDITDWIAEGHGLEEFQELIGRAVQFISQKVTRGFHFIRACDLETTKPEYVDLDKKIEKDTNCSYFGDSEAGKTAAAIDINCKVAALGRICFYIVGEGQRGFKRRLIAWCTEHDTRLEDLPLYLSMISVPMNDEHCVGQVIEAIRELAQMNGDPALITIDSLARNLEGDENSPVDMGAFIRGIDRIRVQFHCATLTIHHSGHMAKERSRGHSSWKAALDTEYRFDKDEDGTIRMICTKSKDSAPPEPCAFKLKQVPLPGIVDDDGRDVFSIVLVPAEYEPKAVPGKTGRGKWQQTALHVHADLLARYRANLEADGRDPDTARVTLDDWREACLAGGIPRRTFFKVKAALKAESLLSIEHGFVSALHSAVPLSLQTKGTNGTHEEEHQGHKGHSKGTANGTQRAPPADDFEDAPLFPDAPGEPAKIAPEDIF